MVWQRQERVAPPSLYRVPGLVPLGPEVVEEGGEGLQVEASGGAGGEGATDAVLEFPEGTPVRQRLSAGAARAPRVEEAGDGEVSEGEEGGPGPP